MIEKLKNIFGLIANIIKSRWIIIALISATISSAIWLNDLFFSHVTIRIPFYVTIIIGTLALYPILKLIQFLFTRSNLESINYGGLSWKPSRYNFRPPKPKCPHCGSNISYSVERKPLHVARSLSDFENIEDKMIRHIYECPNHGRLQVPNKPFDYLQGLAENKIDSAT